MATERKRRNKNGLERLSAWPHPSQSRPVRRHVRPDRPGRTIPNKAIAHDLPVHYHETYIRVIPRDPHLLFSFWEIAAGPGVAPHLRLYETDSGDGGTIIGDYAVEQGARSRYIRVPHPGRRYRLVFGTGAAGRFVPLCSSNEVTAPAGHMRHPLSLTKENRVRPAAAEALAGFSACAQPFATSPQGAAADMTELSDAL
jgi:hypothetical protein